MKKCKSSTNKKKCQKQATNTSNLYIMEKLQIFYQQEKMLEASSKLIYIPQATNYFYTMEKLQIFCYKKEKVEASNRLFMSWKNSSSRFSTNNKKKC